MIIKCGSEKVQRWLVNVWAQVQTIDTKFWECNVRIELPRPQSMQQLCPLADIHSTTEHCLPASTLYTQIQERTQNKDQHLLGLLLFAGMKHWGKGSLPLYLLYSPGLSAQRFVPLWARPPHINAHRPVWWRPFLNWGFLFPGNSTLFRGHKN